MTLGGGEDVSQRKKILAEKLAKEQANLTFLKESLTKSEQVTQSMLGILSSFDTRLGKLEQNILPVHRETVDLQRRQKNIDKVLRGLDNVISYHNVASSEDQDIRDGPGADVDSYLCSLVKVQDAIGFFERNNPNSPELSLLTSLMETGREQMERSFRNLLTRSSNPVSATTLLDILTACEDTPEGEVEPQLKPLEDEIIDDVAKISGWLGQEAKTSDFMNIYAQIRSNMLSRTLHGLIDDYSKGTIETYSPANIMISTKTRHNAGSSTPTRKSTVKKREIRRVPSKTYENLYGLAGSRKMASPGQAHDSPGLIKEEEDEIEAGRFITLCGSYLKLLQSEQELIKAIIPQDHQHDIFDVLIQSSMEAVVNDGEGMEASAKKLIARREYFSVLPLLPVLKYLGSVLIKFSLVLQGVRPSTQGIINNIFMKLEFVGARALEDFTENIKHDPDKQSNMPKDGTVHELTSNTLIFLEHLLGYTDTVGNMLSSQDQVLDPITRDVESQKRTVARYISRVLGALGLNLELKSKSYIAGQIALSAIFLMNNYNHIVKGLQRTGVILLMKEGGFKDIEEQYTKLIQDQKKAYENGWNKVMGYLLETDKPLPTHHKDSKVGQKHKQLIKDKFKGFNSEFEEICQIQKTYAVPDELLRGQLRKENIFLIVQNYRAFQERYTAVQFSKNMDKYVKYSPEEVEKKLSTLFDLSA